MRTELVITCVTSCASFVWIVFLVKKRLDRFKQLDRLNDSDRFLKTIRDRFTNDRDRFTNDGDRF